MYAQEGITKENIAMYDLTGDGQLTQADIDYANDIGMSSIAEAISNLILGLDANFDANKAVMEYDTTSTGKSTYTPTSYKCNSSCDYAPQPISEGEVLGCTDFKARNYNPTANVEDGSCKYLVPGCTQSGASNYNPNANIDDNSCDFDTAEAKSVFHETFDDKWEWPDMINSKWQIWHVRQALPTDGMS